MKIVFQKITEASPAAPEPFSLAFVEVEDDVGNSINAGEWLEDYCVLHISIEAHIAALEASLLDIDHRNALERLLASQTTPRAWYRLTPGEREFIDRARLGDDPDFLDFCKRRMNGE